MSRIIGATVGTTYNPEKIKPSADAIKDSVYDYLENNFDGILPSGADGSKWFVRSIKLIDERPPSDVTEPGAKEGDILLSTVTYDLYVLTEGVWKLRGNIKGGNGATWHWGDKDVTALAQVTDAKIGDFYLNINTYDCYLADSTGEWVRIGCLKGGNGDKGDKGDRGEPGAAGYSPVMGRDYFTSTDRAEMVDELAEEIITQNTGESTDKVMSQAAVTSALKAVTALPYGGSKAWLEQNGDITKHYQINGYIWGYVEADGWTKSETQFEVVTSTAQMTKAGGTQYLLRNGSEGTVYAYHEAIPGDGNIPNLGALPESASVGDWVAVGGRVYEATNVTETEIPIFTTNYADPSSNEWLQNHRCNSSGVKPVNGLTVTNIITIPAGASFYVSGINLEATTPESCVQHYMVSRGVINSATAIKNNPMFYTGKDGDIYCFKSTESKTTYYRFSGAVLNGDENVIITVDEEITYSTKTEVTWSDIGAYTPPVAAGWSETDETYSVVDTFPTTASKDDSAVYSVDGFLYSFVGGSDWVQLSRYDAPTIAIDGELSDSSTNAVQNKIVTQALTEVNRKVSGNADEIVAINERIANIEVGNTAVIPSWWQDAVDECIAKIKTLQTDKNCVTFPFFSDNHTRDGKAQHMGIMIAHVMKECGIPYCFCGGDAITSAEASTADSDAEFKAQAKAFDTAMSYIPDGRFCMALGNHETVLKYNSSIAGSVTATYDRNQTYNIFLREKGTAQNKHFGSDGTYYYVDDIVSKVRWIVLNTNGIGNSAIDSDQLLWFEDTALKFSESGWGVVIISHVPIANVYEQSQISNAATVIDKLKSYMTGTDANKADIIGWYSGHVHRDRIYTDLYEDGTDLSPGTVVSPLGFKQITITSDHTGIAYKNDDGTDSFTKHPVGNDDLSHAIDFVTINKSTRTVNLTRLGIGVDRQYTY